MIPLIDIYLKETIQKKIDFLREHPEIFDSLFQIPGENTILTSFKEFVLHSPIYTLIGYPRDQQSFPCIVITVAEEHETPLGVGENIDDYEEPWDDGNITTQYVLSGVGMNASYRLECWSDNGNLTSYLYAMLKWCLLASRDEMLLHGLKTQNISGSDFEPVPDYLTMFVYRRALILNCQYEMTYFHSELKAGEAAREFPIDASSNSIHINCKTSTN